MKKYLCFIIALTLFTLCAVPACAQAVSFPLPTLRFLTDVLKGENGHYTFSVKLSETPSDEVRSTLQDILNDLEGKNPNRTACVVVQMTASYQYIDYLRIHLISFDKDKISYKSYGDGSVSAVVQNGKHIRFSDFRSDDPSAHKIELDSPGMFSAASTSARRDIAIWNPLNIEFPSQILTFSNINSMLPDIQFPDSLLTINYVFEDGTQAHAPFTRKLSSGSAFLVTSPEIAGYVPDAETVSGAMGDSDLTYTVTYKKIKHGLTILYQYEDGSQAHQTYSGQFAEGESFSVHSPSIGGFKPSIDDIAGKMGNTDLTYTVKYKKITHTLTVYYKYTDGVQALEPYTAEFAEGEHYSVIIPPMDGYLPSIEAIAGEMGTSDQTYTVTYAKDRDPEPPPSSSGSSGGNPSGGSGGSTSGGSGQGSSGGSGSGNSSGTGNGGASGTGSGSGENPYIVWDPGMVSAGFNQMKRQAGSAFNSGIWVFLMVTGIVLVAKLIRDLFH